MVCQSSTHPSYYESAAQARDNENLSATHLSDPKEPVDGLQKGSQRAVPMVEDPPVRIEDTTQRRRSVPMSSSASASSIRSRFLNRLGINGGSPVNSPPSSKVTIRSNVSTRPRHDPIFVSLKADHGLPDADLREAPQLSSSVSSSSSSKSSSSFGKNGKGVSFDVSVTVHPIPVHTEYSSRIRGSLWTPSNELQASAARNCLEFAAENWDWRQVAEDDDMIIYHGERIHPIHFAQEYRQRYCSA